MLPILPAGTMNGSAGDPEPAPKRVKGELLSLQEKCRIAYLLGKGWSQRAIAKHLGVSNGSVSKIAAELRNGMS